MTLKSAPISGLAMSIFLCAVVAGCSDGKDGAEGPSGPAGAPGAGSEIATSVESCVGCHGPLAAEPVMDITDTSDVHYIDTDSNGPLTPAGYRQVNLTLSLVDVSAASVVIEFDAADENAAAITDLFAADGRFTIARLDPSAAGDPSQYVPLIINSSGQGTSERFTSGGGLFENLGGGSYRYTAVFDPTGLILSGDTMRVAIQISASDIPPGNGWCDFDANLLAPNDCISAVSVTRDIVKTATCNGCHGVTSDTQLGIHGGGRTQVEYCVTCHNPTSIDPDSGNTVNLTVLIHKIHYGANLTVQPYQIIGYRNSVHDYSTVEFTKDIDNCTNCHTGGGVDESNWNTVPSMEACQSCHDDVNVATGANHNGGAWPDNSSCATCHPPTGVRNLDPFGIPQPVATVHQGVARAAEAALYTGGANGFSVDDLTLVGNDLAIEYSVTRAGGTMDLDTDPEWTGGGASRLVLSVGWSSEPDYTNEGSGSTPAIPMSINAIDIGGVVTDLGGGSYEATATLPSSASDTVVVTIDGHPAADIDGDGTYGDRIAVKNVFAYINVEGGRATPVARRQVVNVAKCNQCHDAAGQGISLHGNNRTSEIQVCVVCHNGNMTDINRRPTDPTTTADGKTEESVHFRRMIHQIHSGAELENGVVIYGFGGSEHDYSTVEFIGNRENCETCHDPGTYGIFAAKGGIASTIDTGADAADPDDDLNISNTAAVCSSCHDDSKATDHMKLNGALFDVLDENIL